MIDLNLQSSPTCEAGSSTTPYHLETESAGDSDDKKDNTFNAKERRHEDLSNVEVSKERNDPCNIISLRYRADSMTDSALSETDVKNTEDKVWGFFEKVFCFLKGLTIYQTRRRLKLIIVWQAGICTFRIIPILLGVSYRSTVPVVILYITLIFGWHGTKFLVPRFLLLYKIGMQVSLLIDAIWYLKGYNGKLTSVSEGTALLMQSLFSVILSFLNIGGLLYGWKLRRLVKIAESSREFDRAALATMVPPVDAQLHSSVDGAFSRLTRSADQEDDEADHKASRRVITVGSRQSSRCEEQSTLSRSLKSTEDDSTWQQTLENRSMDTSKQQTQASFPSNLVESSKYTLLNFPFVFLKMQFSRLANIYTTMVVMLCFFSFSPVSPISSLTPLLIVFATSAIKDFTEDLRRKKSDEKVNSRPAHLVRYDPDSVQGSALSQIEATWKDIRVGDIVLLRDGEEVPADCILLATSRQDGRCYVETANLDGETNLKIRSVVPLTKHFLTAEDILQQHQLYVECDEPNKDLFSFDGILKLHNRRENASNVYCCRKSDGSQQRNSDSFSNAFNTAVCDDEKMASLNIENLILRGSESRNATWTMGLVIYTGKDTKIMLNSSGVPLKRSSVEKSLDTMFVLVLLLLFGISIACTLGNNDWDLDPGTTASLWYLGLGEANSYIFLSYVILFNNLIPLSMYVTMEGVRFVHARFIENDLEMYDAATDTPAQVRNSNINEDLGQIQYIFSDKTGTLTRNEMVFAKCTIAGLRYNDVDASVHGQTEFGSCAGTRFTDQRLLARLNANHSTKEYIHEFLLLLTICNTVIPEVSGTNCPDSNESTDQNCHVTDNVKSSPHASHVLRYNAASPDELALVLAAKELDYVLAGRDGSFCHTCIQGQSMMFEILHVLEFNSDRKRMSVIARHPDGRIVLYCKGADDVIFDLLSKSQPQGVAHVTRGHLQEYASEGLRTLTAAMRVLPQEEYDRWRVLYREAEMSMYGRAGKISKVSAMIEVDLTLLGATAIEDRLQEGAEECITSLRKAGIKFWVLTGDKKETAISIGMSSQVIDDDMDVIVLGQRDKVSLRSRLEELYVELVDDKWGSDENASVTMVLVEAAKKAGQMLYEVLHQAIVGRDQQTEQRRRRRRVRNREDIQNENEFNVQASQSGHHSALGDKTEGRNELFDEVYSVGMDHGLGDQVFEPQAQAGKTEEFHDEDVGYAMVIDGQTLSLVLDNDIKYLFLAVATQCKSVICCRCSPSQKAAVVKLVTEPTLMFSPGNISLAIGDGANDVPMIQAANVGVGISGKEGRQAVLSSDYSFAQFRFLKRLLLVHGNYSYKRISKLILFSFMKNVALSLSNFFLATYSMYSGVLMYFGIFFTLYNALFTTIPIVVIAMYNQDVSPAVLMQYPSLYVNGLRNRSFNWITFFGWCGLGMWHAYAIYAITFFTNGFVVYYFANDEHGPTDFGEEDVGLWACGVAAYTYLITASTAQVALMTSNWTRTNVIATVGTLLFYYLFAAFFCNVYGWTGGDIYEIGTAYSTLNKLVKTAWFWFGLVLVAIVAVLPNYIAKTGRVLFYPEPADLMREWNRLKRKRDATEWKPTQEVESPRLVRNATGFAFSNCPQESEMVFTQRNGFSDTYSDSPTKETLLLSRSDTQ